MSSHNWLREIRLELVNFGRIMVFLAFSENSWDRETTPVAVVCIILLFGSCTGGSCFAVTYFLNLCIFATNNGC